MELLAEDFTSLPAPAPPRSGKVLKLRERFNNNALSDDELVDPYELKLVDGWKRCEEMGIDPSLRRTMVVPQEELRRISQDNALLLDKARQAMNRVSELLCGIPGAILLTDAGGTILHVADWPSRPLRDADTSNFIPGARFCETVAGTNGIAEAIAQRSSVRVHAAEHYCEGWHRWSCTASPIFDPFNGAVIGVVDFSVLAGYESDMEPLTLSLAEKIREDLRVQIGMERLRLLEEYRAFAARYPSDIVVAYDRAGHLIRSTLGVQTPDSAQRLASMELDVGGVHRVYASNGETPIGTVLVAPSIP